MATYPSNTIAPAPSLTRGYGSDITDPDGANQVSTGGNSSALNITAVGTLKNSPGRVCKILVNTAASAGTLTFNDMLATGTAAAANQVAAIPFGLLTAGAAITLDYPFAAGIQITGTWPTGLVASISFH